MTLRAGLLNGNNITQDYDFGYLLKSLAPNGGINDGFAVETGVVNAGNCFIPCERTNGNKPFVFVELLSNQTIDTTGTKKVWIEIAQAIIDDGATNNEDGTGIAEIKTGASYPTKNFLPLASIVDGTITDGRVMLKTKKSSVDLDGITSAIYTTETIHAEKDISTDGNITAGGEMTAGEFNTPSGGLQEQINNIINSLGIINPNAGEVVTSGKGTYIGTDGLQYEYRGDYFAKTILTATHSLTRLVGIDETRFLIITTVGGYGTGQQHYATVGELVGNTITFGTPVLLITGQGGMGEPQKIDTDKFVIGFVYYNGSNTHLGAIVITIDGDVITKGSATDAYSVGGGGPSYWSCCKVATNSFIISGHADVDGIYAATVSGTTITFGTKVNASYSLLVYASDGVVVAFNSTAAYRITVSGTVPVIGSGSATGLTASSHLAINYASNKIIYGARSTDLKIMFIDVSGATPTMGPITTVHTGEEIATLNMFSSNVIMVGPNTTARLYFYYTDGTTFYSQSYVTMPGVGATGNLVKTRGVFGYGGYMYGITNGGLKIIGIAQATGIIGEPLITSTVGKKSSVHSGLIAGLNAYLSRQTGNIEYASTGIFIGQVLSDTELVVGINY